MTETSKTSTDDLIMFLDHRIDEDERIAEDAMRCDGAWPHGSWPPSHFAPAEFPAELDKHIARHDPARALRDAYAKRARLADWEYAQAKFDDVIANPGKYSAGDEGMWLGKTAASRMACCYDAAVYGDDPDYRPEWKP